MVAVAAEPAAAQVVPVVAERLGKAMLVLAVLAAALITVAVAVELALRVSMVRVPARRVHQTA